MRRFGGIDIEDGQKLPRCNFQLVNQVAPEWMFVPWDGNLEEDEKITNFSSGKGNQDVASAVDKDSAIGGWLEERSWDSGCV